MRFRIKLLIKLIIAATVLILLTTLTTYYQPVIGANLAVDQLRDEYSSNVGVKIWRNFKDYWIFAYALFAIALFAGEIKRLTNKKY